MTSTQINLPCGAYIAHIILPSILSLLLFSAGFYDVYAFEFIDFDYGLFSNLFWNFAHGNGWFIPLFDTMRAAGTNFLSDHLALIVPFFAPLFKLFPSIYTLTFLHNLAFAAVFFLVPVFIRDIWKEYGNNDYIPSACFLLLALFFFKGYAAAWKFQTHLVTLVMPFILCALIALHKKKWFWTLVCCILVILSQERGALAVFSIGMYALLVRKYTCLGLFLCTFSAVYFFVAVKYIIPSFAADDSAYLYNTTINLFVDIPEKIIILVQMIAAWFLLPFCGKKAFLAALCTAPHVAIYFASSRKTMYSFEFHYHDVLSLFAMVASAYGILWLTAQPWFKNIPRYALLGCSALVLTGSALFSGDKLPFYTLSRMTFPVPLTAFNKKIDQYSDSIPPHVAVYTTAGIGSRFTMRKLKYQLALWNADKEFHSAMLFIAPHLTLRPDKGLPPEKLLARLDANSSIERVATSDELVVYKSKDIVLSP